MTIDIDNAKNHLLLMVKTLKERSDYTTFFEKYFRIKDRETAEVIPFKVNKSQKRLLDIIQKWDKDKSKNKKTLFVIILKARKEGFSTCTEALFLQKILFEKHKTAMVVSYDDDSARYINSIADVLYQYLPDEMKPDRRLSRGNGILLENPKYDPNARSDGNNDPGLQSQFLIETARNVNAGSAFTINYLHISELAKWSSDVDVTMTSLLQAVPSTNSIVIVESTALGYNYFKDLWDKAVSSHAKGGYGYIPLFIPWFDDEGYSFPYSGFILTEEEKQFKKMYKLTNNQLEWRRWCIATKCDGDINRFHQEYPSNPKEAFLSTGLSVFDKQKLNVRYETLRQYYEANEPRKGHFLFEMKDNLIDDSSIRFAESEPKYITIYNEPKDGHPYVIGGDVAEGGADRLAGQVISNRDGTQAAVLHGYMDTDDYARQIYCLGKYYNTALVSIEANFNKVPIKVLQDLLYWNMFKRETVDSIEEHRQEKYGFVTDRFTRPIIIDLLKSVVRDSVDTLSDMATIDEMFTFVYNKMNKAEAEAGKHDDLVIALAIAHYSRGQMWTEINDEYSFKNIRKTVANTIEHDDDDEIQANDSWFD
jgi:hypothetical protein